MRFLVFFSLLLLASPCVLCSEESSIQSAIQWALDHGYTLGPFAVGQIPGRPRGLIATRDIKDGELIIGIPRIPASFININDMRDTPIIDLWNHLKTSDFKFSDTDTVQKIFLAVLLVWHERQGDASPFAYYLKHLPAEIHLQGHYTHDEMLELSYASLYDSAASYQRSAIHDFTYISQELELLKFRHIFNPRITWAEFIRMFELIISRDFTTQDGEATLELIPIFDLANHDASPNMMYDDANAPQFLNVTAQRDISAGEELTITYGDKSAYDFLRGYGFVPESVTVTALYFDVDLDTDDPYYRAKAKVLEENTEHLAAKPGHVPEALNVLRVLLSDNSRVLESRAIKRHLEGLQLGMEAEADVIKWYIDKMNSMLTFYPPLEMRGLPMTVPEDKVTETIRQIITYRDWEQGVILASIQEAMDLLEKNAQRVI